MYLCPVDRHRSRHRDDRYGSSSRERKKTRGLSNDPDDGSGLKKARLSKEHSTSTLKVCYPETMHEDDLAFLIKPHAPIKSVYAPSGKGFAVVQLYSTRDAEVVMNALRDNKELKFKFGRDSRGSGNSADKRIDERASNALEFANLQQNAKIDQSGYVFDPNSGYHVDASTGFWYDSKTQLYFNPSVQQWGTMDNGAFMTCSQKKTEDVERPKRGAIIGAAAQLNYDAIVDELLAAAPPAAEPAPVIERSLDKKKPMYVEGVVRQSKWLARRKACTRGE